MAEDHSSMLEKVVSIGQFVGDGRIRGWDHQGFFSKVAELAQAIAAQPKVMETLTWLLGPMGRTTVDQYTTGIKSLDLDDQYDHVFYTVQKWFDVTLQNKHLHFFWMARLDARGPGVDYDLIGLTIHRVFGLEPALSLRNLLGPETFEPYADYVVGSLKEFYRRLGYHEQPWTNVPPGGEAKIGDHVITVWDQFDIAVRGLMDEKLLTEVLYHPRVYDGAYYPQQPSNIYSGRGGEA